MEKIDPTVCLKKQKQKKTKNIRKIIVNPKKQKDLTFYGCNNVYYVF